MINRFFLFLPFLMLAQGCGMMFTYLAEPDDSPQSVAETRALYEPAQAQFLDGYNKLRRLAEAGVGDSGQMRLAIDNATECQKLGAYLASGPSLEDAQWRHLPKPTYKAHPEFDWGSFGHIWSGTIPEDQPLYPDSHEFDTDFGPQVFSQMQIYCRQKHDEVVKLKLPGCYLHTAEALVPWLGAGQWGEAAIRIPSWSCPAKKTEKHDLSGEISDNPLACADMPQGDTVPDQVVEFHKRLKRMYCPKGIVEYGGDLFESTKEGCERARYARMFCYATVEEVKKAD